MQNFSFIKEHRLIFDAETPQPVELADQMNLPENSDDLLNTVTEQVGNTAEQSAGEASDLLTAAGINRPENPTENTSEGSAETRSETAEKATEGIENGEIKEAVDGFAKQIETILNSPDFKNALASLAAAFKTFLEQIKGMSGSKEGTATTSTEAAESSESRESGNESTNESTERSSEAPKNRLKEELEEHVAENPDNNVDTLIAKKEAEKAEKLPQIEQKLEDLEAQRDAVKNDLDGMENDLHDLEVKMKRADDPEVKDDLEAQIKMIEADIKSEEEKLKILDEEIDEEIAKEDEVRNGLDADIDGLKEMKEASQAVLDAANRFIDACKEADEDTPDADVKALIDSMGCTMTNTLDVEFSIDENVLNTLADRLQIEHFNGLENGVTKDVVGLTDYLVVVFTKLTEELKKELEEDNEPEGEESEDETPPPPTPPSNEAKQEEPSDDAEDSGEEDEESDEDSEEQEEDNEQSPETRELPLQEWADRIDQRCDELGYGEITVEVNDEGEIVMHGSREDMLQINAYAAERGMVENADFDAETATLYLNITEDIDIGLIGPNFEADKFDEPNQVSPFDSHENQNETEESDGTPERLVPEVYIAEEQPIVPPVDDASNKSPEYNPNESEVIANVDSDLNDIAELIRNSEPGHAESTLDQFNEGLQSQNLSDADLDRIKNIAIFDVERPNDQSYDIFYDDIDSKFVMKPTLADLPLVQDNGINDALTDADFDKPNTA